jgi:FkbM family methyltransferase
MREIEEILDGVDPERARVVDALFFDRLVLGRNLDPDAGDEYRGRIAGKSPFELLRDNISDTPGQMRYPHVPCTNRELMWQRDDGMRIFFNLRDLAVGLQICQGTFDPEIEQLLDRMLAPGMSVLDIGANLGYYTLQMARAGARVHAFEAFPYNHSLLTKNIAENGLADSVVPHLVGVASEAGTGRVCIAHETTNMGSMFILPDLDSPVPDGFDAIEIPLARVDDLVPETEIIEIVKIDIEGAELAAFQGMDRILGRDRPVILLELNSRTLRDYHGVEPRELVAFLRDYGYRLAEATSMLTGAPAMVGDIPHGAHVFANLVCFPA